MTPEQKAAYVYAQATSAMIEAMGMDAENRWREANGNSIAYGFDQFYELIERYGTHHNATTEVFRND